jgi:GNAT superfamily N-acetyltransferase
MDHSDISIDQMTREEVSTLEQWACTEGWNPGRADIGIAWQFDPQAFIAMRREGELIAGGTVMSYGGQFGFMGLFIVRSDVRGEGLGARLWHHRRDRLLARLKPGATIGMDGVFNMVPFYTRGGFRLAWRDLRFEGVAHGQPDPHIIGLETIGLSEIERFDRRFFRWLEARCCRPGSRSLVLTRWVSWSQASLSPMGWSGLLSRASRSALPSQRVPIWPNA